MDFSAPALSHPTKSEIYNREFISNAVGDMLRSTNRFNPVWTVCARRWFEGKNGDAVKDTIHALQLTILASYDDKDYRTAIKDKFEGKCGVLGHDPAILLNRQPVTINRSTVRPVVVTPQPPKKSFKRTLSPRRMYDPIVLPNGKLPKEIE